MSLVTLQLSCYLHKASGMDLVKARKMTRLIHLYTQSNKQTSMIFNTGNGLFTICLPGTSLEVCQQMPKDSKQLSISKWQGRLLNAVESKSPSKTISKSTLLTNGPRKLSQISRRASNSYRNYHFSLAKRPHRTP